MSSCSSCASFLSSVYTFLRPQRECLQDTPEVYRDRYARLPTWSDIPPLLDTFLKSKGIDSSTGRDQVYIRNERAAKHLLHRTLRGRETLGAAVYYFVQDEQKQVTEAIVHWSLGASCEGPSGKCHGGLIAALLDDACGGFTNTFLRSRGRQGSAMTAYLRVDYKLPTLIPGDCICAIELDRHEGRKVFVKGKFMTLQNGSLSIACLVEALFVELKQPLPATLAAPAATPEGSGAA
mmetsp:Transcript_49153/g.117098  ORF Transcript_49153/g.117098 Transcript_49153/m.117098 type:complete len:236 (+) Transcript_49153:71-778(+)